MQRRKAEKLNNEMASVTLIKSKNSLRAFQYIKLGALEISRTGTIFFRVFRFMHPGDIPISLKDLSYIEKMLFSLVYPAISMRKFCCQQHGHSENVINFLKNAAISVK